VLSKCRDAHIYLYQGTCSPFQRWQSAFVSSGIWGRVSVGRVANTLKANGVTWLRTTVLPQWSQGPDGACPRAPPKAPSCARWPRAATFGAWRAHDDPRVIVPARRLLLRRRVGGCWRHLAARLQAPRRTSITPTRPPMRRVGRPARCEQVRCAAEWWPRPWASRDAGGPPPLRWRRRHPFPRSTPPPPRQRGCTCPRARSRLWCARCRCVAERATALKARVLHARAWNLDPALIPEQCRDGRDDGPVLGRSKLHSESCDKPGAYVYRTTASPIR